MLTRREVIGIKTEAAQNTPVACTATDMILAADVDIAPIVMMNERTYYHPSLSPLQWVAGKTHLEVKFRTELKGGGAAGTAYVPLGAALMACAESETIVGSTSVTYNAVSAPFSAAFFTIGKSCSIEIYRDGKKYVVKGCVGNAKVMLKAGEIAFVDFEFKGLYSAPTDVAIPTATYLGVVPPIVQSGTLTLMGVATHVAASLEIDFGNEVVMRESVAGAYGVGGFQVTGRTPTMSIDPEDVLVATDPLWADLLAGVQASCSYVLGTAAGNIITITAPKGQWTELRQGDRNGILTSPGKLILGQNTGDDHLVIAMT